MDHSPAVLVLAAACPWPADSGARQRAAETIHALSRRTSVTVVCFSKQPDEAGARGKAAGFELLAAPYISGFLSKLTNALNQTLRGRPLQYTFLDTPPMRALLRSIEHRFDAIVVQELSMAGVAIGAGLHRAAPTILDQFNAEYSRAKDIGLLVRQPVPRLRHELHVLGLRSFEPWAVKQMAGCIFVSKADQETVLKAAGYPAIRSIVLPSGVNGDRRHFPRANSKPREPVIAFVGSFDYLPNISAARWLVEDVMPRVRQEVPAELHLIGRHPHRSVIDFSAIPWVRLHANVADPAPFLASADAVAIPVRHGGGTKLKTLEALASGRPVVSTTVGIQGLDVNHGDHLLIADEAYGFADALLSVLTDRQLARRLSNAGWTASQAYSWTRIGAAYADFVLSFSGGQRNAV